MNKEVIQERIKVAVDAMGGDFAPKEIVEGVNLAIKAHPELEVKLYGDTEQINKYLVKSDRVEVIHAAEKLDMGEKDPVMAIRRGKELSMVKAFKAVHDKECLGAVTAGPTQGVVVAAHMIVKKLPGMARIALCPTLPLIGGKHRLLLDCGGNVEIRPEHLVQIAHFASSYLKEASGIEKPVVGLINIGSEPGKGREQDRITHQLLTEDPDINFYGNIEPKEMLYSECDILLAEGYQGNLVMKAVEGTAKAVGGVLKEEISNSFWAKIGYVLFMKKAMNKFKKRMNSDEVGGSLLFGVDGVIVKAHGSSSAYAFSKGIERCMEAIKIKFIETMRAKLEEENKNE